LISEIYRVLKPAGILYINDFLINTDERNQSRYRKFEAKYGVYGIFELPEGAVLRHHSEKWLKELLYDFRTLKYEHLTFTTMNGHKSNGFYFIGEKA
jgi:ubiquinone/menaquinone biosynthesis C-methylase UbiE